ncbi:hypothetical protein [Conexibacter arvalis]|uniref:Uncharacterized protein n=1 Tax=Conexibacter arvalis TaxID=912552 RepID=A0A840ICC2_9ACTN|nr:hypothetical protein [Conexibacter arvalis]MBB4661708.1 hypothetical protein [Conexibacter arvalis]
MRAAALTAALAVLAPAAPAAAADRFAGQVTDALRTPVRKLAAGPSGRAVADLVFLDRERAGTTYRTCVVRRAARGARGARDARGIRGARGARAVRTCFKATSGAAGAATVTPLRFKRGRYVVRWMVAGEVVARWRFAVV